MNQNIIHNIAYNYLSSYKLSLENFEEMKKLVAEITKTKFYLYKRLCEWVLNSRVAERKCSFVIEIDAEKERTLSTRTKTKKGSHTEVGKLFFKIKVFK